MLDYNGKIAGITIRENSVKYAVTISHPDSIEVLSVGEIDLNSANAEPLSLLRGCRCIYGINRDEYHRKRLFLADDLAVSDPDQFLWELARSSAESIDNYLYSLLQLQPQEKGIHIECLSVNKDAFNKIGQKFEKHQLTLDKMIFEPEAIRQTVKPLAVEDRSLLMMVSRDSVELQLFRRSNLVGMEYLRPSNPVTEESLMHLTEEIGTLLMSNFGGRPIRRKLQLISCGDVLRHNLTRLMKAILPYEISETDLGPDQLGIESLENGDEAFHRYFLPLALCYAYTGSRRCASSPDRSAALFSRP